MNPEALGRLVIGMALISILSPFKAWAVETRVDDSKAIHAILGEANNAKERHAIAHAIRNRGHLGGVYGHMDNPSEVEYQAGCKAWYESEYTTDPTHGADHWLSDYDLKHSKKHLIAFRFKMVETAYIGNTHFYKER